MCDAESARALRLASYSACFLLLTRGMRCYAPRCLALAHRLAGARADPRRYVWNHVFLTREYGGC
eukprot:1008831-Rhodomonas_salina.1